MSLGQWRKKNKKCCMMFILTAKSKLWIPWEPAKLFKDQECLKNVFIYKKIYFRVRKVKWATKNTC